MRAEIFSIGTELLLGQIVDTNAVYIAQSLAELGIPLYFKNTVGDNRERLQSALRLSLERSDLIICTGGLGPTGDDITTESIAEVVGEPLMIHPKVREDLIAFFSARGREASENQLKQALFPRGATLIPNSEGTAPGFIISQNGKTLIVLPGPPVEMKPMWQKTVVPLLREKSGMVIHSRTLRFIGVGEGSLDEMLREVIDAQTNPTVAPYAKMGEVHIRVTARAKTVDEAEKLIAPVEKRIREIAGRFIYGINDDTLEAVVGRLLTENNLTLAVAESCTGGLLGGRITEVAGSSAYFLGGIISYSNEIKRDLLDVPAETLAAHGAVSVETARAMAEGVRKRIGAHIGVSVTGIAGPGGATPEKPLGLVFVGISGPNGETRAFRQQLWGSRASVRENAAQRALIILHDRLTGREVKTMTLPSLVGYPPEDAERIAAEHNVIIVWAETEKPKWLSPHNEPRVGRQRTLPDGKVELLRVRVPTLPSGD